LIKQLGKINRKTTKEKIMGIESSFIWINGDLAEYKEATIHILNPSLHYGVGAFEGIRMYQTDQGPAVFRLKEHMERFVDSAKVLGITELEFSVDDLIRAVCLTVDKNGFNECYIRPLLYFTGETLGLKLDGFEANIGIAVWEWRDYLGAEAQEKGIRATISSFTRHHPNVTMTKAKITGNYANGIMAKTNSIRLGFDEAIMLDPDGYVAECSGANIFLVRDGKVYTPHKATILEGITRDSLITITKDLGYEMVEEPISRDQLYIADEIFLCGTAAEVIAICEIDFRKIGSGKIGPITHIIQEEYHKAVRGKHPRSIGWLYYINQS
jgi:branched-chain amino acid aminotransferase